MAIEITDALDVYDYLDKWLRKNGMLDFTNPTELKQFMTGLHREIDKYSFVVEGSEKLILYGGWNGEVPMWKVADGASKSGAGFYYISNTDAGKLISPFNDEFHNLIREVCNYNEDLKDRLYGNPNAANGTRSAYVTDDCLSINDYISSNIVKSAKGDVTIWIPNGKENTVFPDTELRDVLKNAEITSINGVPKEVFIDTYNKSAGANVFSTLDAKALDQDALNSVFEEVKKTRLKMFQTFRGSQHKFFSALRILKMDFLNALIEKMFSYATVPYSTSCLRWDFRRHRVRELL